MVVPVYTSIYVYPSSEKIMSSALWDINTCQLPADKSKNDIIVNFLILTVDIPVYFRCIQNFIENVYIWCFFASVNVFFKIDFFVDSPSTGSWDSIIKNNNLWYEVWKCRYVTILYYVCLFF